VLLKHYEGYPSLQAEFELITVAGDILSKPLTDRVRTRICPHLVSVYGSTEASMAATAPAELIQDKPGAVGIVNTDVSVEVVSENDIALPPGTEGIVRIKSPYAADQYVGDAEASARAFRDGWFYPGDFGVLDLENVLHVRGRHDSVLNLGGDKINAEGVEGILRSCDGVAECAVLSAPNSLGNQEIMALIVTIRNIEDEELRAQCARYLSSNFIPTRFIRVASLPRNAMGKIERKSLPTLLRA
jgi:acyl-coenzyme A synthetase/AMP-(fatty) acid ligase